MGSFSNYYTAYELANHPVSYIYCVTLQSLYVIIIFVMTIKVPVPVER